MLTPAHIILNNKSGTITTGGTSQVVWTAQDQPRYYCLFQNVSDTDMTIEFKKPAVAGTGILIKAGVSWEPPAGIMFEGPMSVICATTGKAFVAKIA
jgi:hypothetical protein